MKNICIIILYISMLTVANQKTYGQVINDLQTADSFYSKNLGGCQNDLSEISGGYRDSVRQYQDVTDDGGKIISVTYDLTYLRKH